MLNSKFTHFFTQIQTLDEHLPCCLDQGVWSSSFPIDQRQIFLLQNVHEPIIDGADLGVDPRVAGPPTPLAPAHQPQQLVVRAGPLVAHYRNDDIFQICSNFGPCRIISLLLSINVLHQEN